MDKKDTICADNREIMDYIFDKKEDISNEIYVHLSNLLKKREDKKSDTTKYFKIKYSLTEVTSIAQNFPVESGCDCEISSTNKGLNLTTRYITDTRESILKGVTRPSYRLHFDDILKGIVQLNHDEEDDTWSLGLKAGLVLVNTRNLHGDYQEDVSHVTSTMTILSIEDFNPITDTPVAGLFESQ